MVDRQRKDLVQRLLHDVSRAVQWAAPDGDVSERFARVISTYRLDLDLGDIELSAWLTEDVELAIWVRARRMWTPTVQRALLDALERDGSIVAGLLLTDWTNLTAACASASSDPPQRSEGEREHPTSVLRRK
jgi:hypothetical protein